MIARKEDRDTRSIIEEKSQEADLTIVGFRDNILKHDGVKLFEGYEDVGNILFVNASEQKKIH